MYKYNFHSFGWFSRSVLTVLMLIAGLQSSFALWDDSDPLQGIDLPWKDASTKVEISNRDQLVSFAYRFRTASNESEKNKYAKATIVLTADISLSGNTWRPLGEGANITFQGTLDGQGHKISSMTTGGAGSYWCGFFDSVQGTVTVKNITFSNCTSSFGNYGNSIVIGSTKQTNTKVTFDNVTMNHCTLTSSGNESGLLLGAAANDNCTIEMTHISVVNCSATSSNEHNALLLGYAINSTVNINDVRISNSDLKGNNYTGLLCGWLRANCTTTINNARVDRNCTLNSNGCTFAGGFVGELQGIGTITNSVSQIRFVMSGLGNYSGGMVGKIYASSTKLTVNNCVVADPLNGGEMNSKSGVGLVLGGLDQNAAAYISNVTVCNGSTATVSSKSGYLVGSNQVDSGSGDLHITNCYIPTVLYDNSTRGRKLENSMNSNVLSNMVNKAVGTSRNNSRFIHGNIYPYGENVVNEDQGYLTALMNEAGASLTLNRDSSYIYLRPLDTNVTDGLVVRYYTPDGGQSYSFANYTTPDFSGSLRNNGNWVVAEIGRQLKYNVLSYSRKWIVEDNSTLMKDKKRLSATSFSGVPVAAQYATDKREIKFTAVDNPSISGEDAKYVQGSQRVNLSWHVKDPDVLAKYWKTGKWVVYKRQQGQNNWTLSTDTVAVTNASSVSWSDLTPVPNTVMEYRVELVCAELFYEEWNIQGSNTFSVNCTDSVALSLDYVPDNTGIVLTTHIPNSAHFNGCTMKTYRWSSDQENTIKANFLSKNAGQTFTDKILLDSIMGNAAAYCINTAPFKYEPESSSGYCDVVYNDAITSKPCSELNYVVVCSDFQTSVYKGKTMVTSRGYYQPNREVEITDFLASKGESSSKVRIEWKSKLSSPKTTVWYTLERKAYNASDAGKTRDDETGWSKISEVTNSYTVNTYTDEALPGFVYRYRLRARTACEDTYSESVFEEANDMGFSASRGTIMGKITYNSGATSVQGVDVRLTADSTSLVNATFPTYVRHFMGEDDRLPLATGLGNSFWDGDWTVQFLLRPQINDERRPVLNIPGRTAVEIQNDKLFMAGQQMTINLNNYNHLMLTHQNGSYKLGYAETPTATDGEYAHWGITVDNATMQQWLKDNGGEEKGDSLLFGRTDTQRSFKGFLDEVRVWSKSLSDREVQKTYDRYLTGNEDALMAYYTFDAGVVEREFDTSHPGGIWNNHHASIMNINGEYYPNLDSQNCPDEETLCYRGTTNERGEYQIAGIPFSGEGTNFIVVPIYGTHEFQPAKVSRYVSAQSLAHNDVDFTDISSFPVPIKVNYAWGDYPAKGISVYVDNSEATRDNVGITTDANGECTVDVPIGTHKLYIVASGHTFVNDGYACSIDSISSTGDIYFTKLQGDKNLIDFQSTPTAAFTFYDKTMYRLAGRVVGGDEEGNKSLGGGLSKNNIGQVKLTLEPTMKTGYSLNSSDVRDIEFDCHLAGDTIYTEDNINCTTKFVRGSSKVEILTDKETGEYLAWLPPVDMTIKDICTVGSKGGQLDKDAFGLGNSPATISYNLTQLSQDTLYADTTGMNLTANDTIPYRYFKYNGKKSYTYYTEPQIEVYNPANIGGLYPQMLGDSIMTKRYTDSYGKTTEDIIPLWTSNLSERDGSAKSYMLGGLPVFRQDEKYKFNIKLYESYTNRDSGVDTHYNMSGVALNINNTLATKTAQVLTTGENFAYALATDSVAESATSNSDGIVEYEFQTGFPNPVEPYALDFSINYTVNGKYHTYPEEGTIQGIVLGYVNIPGTDFVTAGPDLVSFVLRDPPGSGSYSWIEQGSTITNSNSWSEGGSVDRNDKLTLKTGTTTQTFELTGGVGQGIIKSLNASDKFSSASGSLTLSTSVTGAGSTKLTYSVKNTIKTSSSAGYVGSNGDVYIGTGTNFVYSRSKILDLVRSDEGTVKDASGHGYALNFYTGNSSTSKYTSTFEYSQKYIQTILIPKLRNDRYALADSCVTSFEGLPSVSPFNRPMYFVLQSTDKDKSNWKEGVDYVSIFPETGNYSDSIQSITSFITNWEKQIQYNDSIKYNTAKLCLSKLTHTESVNPANTYSTSVDYGYMGNVSFDAGSSLNSTLTRTYSSSNDLTESHSEKFALSNKSDYTTKVLFVGNVYKHEYVTTAGQSGNEKMGKDQSYTQTFGYQFADANAGDYFSVDTYLPGYPKESGTLTELTDGNSTPAFDQFYVFRLRGGQSKCPYQAEEYSKYYKVDGEYAKIGDGTIAIDDPVVTFPKKVYTDVPNGQPFNIPFTVANTSSATVKLASVFNLIPSDKNNPDGLEFYVDGLAITGSSPFLFTLMPGQSVEKTLKVVQTKNDVLDYENLQFILYSGCEIGRRGTDNISIHFKPISSPVSIKQNTNVLNKENQTLKLTVSDFDKTYRNFKGINVQYKGVNDLDWNTYYVLVADSTDGYWTGRMPDEGKWALLGKDDGKNEVYLDLSGIADGKYQFRALSFSANGTELITNTSDTVSVTKDTVCPDLLNKPLTFYDGTRDIEVQFTEPLDIQLLTDNNFKVTGVLNEAEVTHESGIHFDGSTPAKTNSRVDIFGQNTTVGFWYKPHTGKTSCLFSQIINQGGSDPQLYALYYNADATMTLRLGDKTYTSIRKAVDNEGTANTDWMYASLIINHDESRISLINLFGTTSVDQSLFLYEDGVNITGDTNVPLYVGGSVYGSGEPCYAEMESFVIYDGAKEIADIASEKDDTHSANTRGLLAYWPMDEGDGMTARDIVRQRNLTLTGTDNWYLPVTNYALHLDGSQYMTINTSACPVSSNADYVLEFWFRSEGSKKETQTLFSNGWGGPDSPEADVKNRTSLSLGAEGQIIYESNGYKVEVGDGYNDEQWHHLALNVQRDGYATLMVDTIVVNNNFTCPGNLLGAFENSDMTIGARRYRTDAVTYQVDRFFTGMIDEVRIWRAYRTLAAVRARAFSRLTGEEPGLVAYYPFEYSKLVSNQKVTYPTLSDRVVENKMAGIVAAADPTMVGYKAADITSLAEEATNEDGPRLKAADFISVVDIDWKTNGTDKIVLSFPDNLGKDRIENCTLNMTVQNMKDLVGNRMEQPYTWNVYVSQNPLSWATENNSLRQQIGYGDDTRITIYNSGSTTQNWSVEDVPAWAHLSQASGSLKPYSSMTITLETKEETSIGKYSGVMYLVGNDEIYTPMNVSLSVTGETPNWLLADTDGSVWMSLFGRLKINGTWSTDEDDWVGVFAPDGRCLALGSPKYNEDMDTYFLQLNVMGDKEDANSDLSFQVWDASTGLVYTDVSLPYKSEDNPKSKQKFINKAVLGSFDNPYVISTREIIRQTINLHEGWNWISMWVTPGEGMNAEKIFAPIVPYISDVKSRLNAYNPSTLSNLTLTLSECYHIYANEAVTFTVEGAIANPDTVKMNFNAPKSGKTNYQWIGFPLTNSKSLAAAFADLTCSKNDVVKGEDNFAMYNGTSWVGELTYLSPGRGYLYGYYGTDDKTWTYPNKVSRKVTENQQPFTLDVDPYNYEDYTFVEAIVKDGGDLYWHDYQLAAFDEDGLCHGIAEAKAGTTCPIVIFGEEGETYTFRLYDKETKSVYEVIGDKAFDSNTPAQSVNLLLVGEGIHDINTDDYDDGHYYNLGGARQGGRPQQRGVFINGVTKKVNK